MTKCKWAATVTTETEVTADEATAGLPAEAVDVVRAEAARAGANIGAGEATVHALSRGLSTVTPDVVDVDLTCDLDIGHRGNHHDPRRGDWADSLIDG